MKKQALTLAQLAMMFDGADATLCCMYRSSYDFNWQADYIFSLPKHVREYGFVHLSERPNTDDHHAFYLRFSTDGGEDEYFAMRGNNNEVVAKLCEIFVQYGEAIRQRNYAGCEKPEEAMAACLDDSFLFTEDDSIVTENAAYSEFVWKQEGVDWPLAKFRHAVRLPFYLYEQRKIGEFNRKFSWGAVEDEMGDTREEDAPLSEICVRYYNPESDDDMIEIPLRVDYTSLPAYLFDFALILGLEETEETEITEA